MLVLLSPAKTLDFTPSERELPSTRPELLADAKQIAAVGKRLSQEQVAELMGLSDRLAEAAHGYFQDWKAKWDAKGSKQAALAFRGDVYQGLDADTLTADDLAFSQQRVRLLSGLYGLLRPLDLIQPYRLEMGRPLANPRGGDLYAFWRERVTAAVNTAAEAAADGAEPLVVNLASNEYFKVINKADLRARLVTPVFKDLKNGEYKVISFFAKRARGMMARYLVQKRASGEAGLRRFRAAGYRYDRELSQAGSPVFCRDAGE